MANTRGKVRRSKRQAGESATPTVDKKISKRSKTKEVAKVDVSRKKHAKVDVSRKKVAKVCVEVDCEVNELVRKGNGEKDIDGREEQSHVEVDVAKESTEAAVSVDEMGEAEKDDEAQMAESDKIDEEEVRVLISEKEKVVEDGEDKEAQEPSQAAQDDSTRGGSIPTTEQF
ncbi:unnamed protein product [Arabis nemorensis]|uniref:Uncharacterized protein n=1 Tax=Arabis nemorensis TaxID=586526 RepID=A0A565B5Q5_9BRAS|nr:unnamed protein product [Arabis nemorensis]